MERDDIIISVSKSEYEFLMKHVRATNSRPIEKWILDGQALEKKKERIRSLTRLAVKSGKMVKGNCEVCGSDKVEAHHSDYSDHLKVKWLCKKHHENEHHKK